IIFVQFCVPKICVPGTNTPLSPHKTASDGKIEEQYIDLLKSSHFQHSTILRSST
ncbi:hypothetical protein QYM36_014120, partial [Artemia franciscana]